MNDKKNNKVYLVKEKYIGEWNTECEKIIRGFTDEWEASKFIEKYAMNGCPYDFKVAGCEDYFYGDLFMEEVDLDVEDNKENFPYPTLDIIKSYKTYVEVKKDHPDRNYDCYIDVLERLFKQVVCNNTISLNVYDSTYYIPEHVILVNEHTAKLYNLVEGNLTKYLQVFTPENELVVPSNNIAFRVQINPNIPDDSVVLNRRIFEEIINENGAYDFRTINICN